MCASHRTAQRPTACDRTRTAQHTKHMVHPSNTCTLRHRLDRLQLGILGSRFEQLGISRDKMDCKGRPGKNARENGTGYAATLDLISEAHSRINPYIHNTPVMTCSTIDEMAGSNMFFKCEMFQKSGAFKFRGAMNATLSLEEQAAKGVVVHSSGNHAAAVALAAKIRGIPAHIVLPTDAPQCKVDAIKGYGGIITLCAPTLEARESTAAEVQKQTEATFIPPYNYGPVICGQGTIALEFLQQVPDLDALIVPVSGCGMISGISVAAKGLNPDIAVIAAEPTGTNSAADVLRSKQAGELVQCERPKTLADGLRGRMGDLTWPIVRDFVDDVITVSEEQIIDAMQLCFERLKLVVEPSGAVGLAAALTDTFTTQARFQGKSIGIVLCGGNVDLAAMGLWKQLRSASEKL